jgi:hypothetical protein
MAQAVATLPPFVAPKRRSPCLRELGIYELPDKRRFVVSTLHRSGWALYPVHTWSWSLDAEYTVNNEGRLLSLGAFTGWGVADLKDTGESASYPKPIIL